ncbi:MAG: beta-glucosidase [Promethearchaeota archaeon]|nr:MAG: beta-glucosidase [Candidatus Lokiarchaeota archaeon]
MVSEKLLYLDPSQPIEKRVDDLISRMTIEEKVAQLGSQYAPSLMERTELSHDKMNKLIGKGIGQITRIGGTLNITPEESVKIANGIQKFLKEQTRLGIPAIVHEECLCGYTAKKATIFPQIIGVASTWEPELVEAMTTKIGEQMRVVGAHQGLSPVLDIARDPRWGRTEETFGEDPYLVSRMGVAYVTGLQGDSLQTGIIATGKHFLGYGYSQGGRNWGPSFIPKRELLEVFAKPFEAAIHESNIGSIMNSYSEIDGIPCGISREILTNLLRNKLGFKGMVVSDYVTIELNCKVHRVAMNTTEAAILAFNAGLEVELPRTAGFGKPFVRAVKKGKVSEEALNQSVARILKKKFELGLFDNPYSNDDQKRILKVFSNPENKKLASEIARKSIILLKNEDNLLPLNKDLKSIALIGPNANSVRNLLGDYTYVGQFEASASNATGVSELDEEQMALLKQLFDDEDPDKFTKNSCEIKSILEAIKEKVSKNTKVNYAKGCEIQSDDKSGFKEAIELAKKSEVVILVVGEKAGLTRGCTSGESRDRSSLTLPGVQDELVREIHATGASIVLVLINGRPLSISWEKENIPAILEAWLPGEEGGVAVADVLFGDYNPGGKLPISVPRSVGQIPIYHNCKPTGGISVWAWNYVEENTTPLFPFGYGLSYTKFEYDNLVINKQNVDSKDTVEISVDVKNIGKIRGDEVVQLYLHDNEATVTRPLEELFGFKRVTLDPGEKATVIFTVSMKQLGFYNENMEYVVEPGNISVYIGSVHANHGSGYLDLGDIFAQKDVKLKGKFKITGETIDLSKDKEFFSKIVVKKKE